MSSSPQSHVDTTDIHDRTRRRPLALACAAALGMMAGVLLSPPVLAAVTTSQGGAGGNNGATHGGSGGAGNGSGGQGGDGDVGLPADGGDGGAGGHGSSAISAGGAGGSVGATTVGGSSVTGGNGVIGETDPALVYTSGGGGGGGAGVYTLDTSINLATGLTLTGGQGGDGGLNNPIAGGGGGGGAGLVVLSGTASINIDGNIVGGDGGDGASGQFSGGGGGGGDGIVLVGGAGVLTNTGSIVGGAGGQAGDATYYAGNHGGGGAGVNLGSDGNTVINSGTIVGGSAIGLPLSGGASGAGMIAGNGTQVTNQVGGSIIGGEASGTGSVGGHGIVATTSGAQSVIIDNHGSIVGGAGGRSLGGSAPSGTGGQAITASGNVSITNGGMIAGGHGGGIGGGRGGIGIDIVVADGEQATITNLGGAVIQGGYGGDLNSGNFGGAGIRADGNVTIVNQAGASILGDEGGLSDISTTGGTAIGADNGVSIDNSGLIAGTGGLGARSAINAHEASIVNRAGGSIIGGNGQGDSAGAVAISSSGGTRIDNAGSIVGGHVDNSGAQANAVLLAGGGNTLQLLAGSSITGNVLSISGSGAGGDSFILGGDVDAPGGNAFDVGGVSGFASYRKSGTSRWTLTGTGSTGQVWTIDAGSLVADALSLVTDVTDNATLVFDQAVDGIYAGIVSGSGNLVKQGTGALTLSDTSRYTGGTTITAGTLQIGNGGTTGSIIGNVANAGTLAFDRSDDVAFAGVVSGTGSLVQQGEGSLALTGDSNYTGGTTITDGTLQIGNGGTTGSIIGDVANAGTLAFDRSNDVAFAGVVAGSGSLVQQGAGTLTLTGANSYTGGTAITDGTLQIGNGGTTGSIVGDVANDGVLAFDRSDDVAFTGKVSGTGSLVQQGAGTLTLTGANSYTGGTMITAGTLTGDTASLQGDIANEAVLRFEQPADGRYAGVLSGGGVLDKRGAGTLALGGDSHAFAGSTRVRAGGLAVDGKLGGDLVMDAGTRLSGTGTLGNLDLAGTLAPGHSIGTLTASGDVVIHDGASYEVETDASGHSDQLAVAGRATLQGGSVLNLARDGAYATQTTYTILTADGGVSGTFGGVTSSLAFLDPTLIYDAHAVQLTLVRNQVDFCAVATTANQCATGQAIQNQGDGPLHEALVTQDAEHARAAMAQWSGESLASTRTALLRDSRFVRDAMSERLHRADSARDDARALGSSAGAIWAHGWEHTGRADGNGNASQARSSGHGLLLGVDAPLGDHLRAGITGGQGQDNTRVDALHDTARVKSRHLGLYAGSRWGAWQLDAGLAQSWHRIDSRRNIDAVLPATVHADYHGRSRQAQLEGSYRFALRRGSVQPFVNLAYVTAHTDALDEHGGVTALHSDSETSEAGFGTLGVRGLWTLAGTGTETSAIYGTLGWRHTFGDRVPLAQQHFADSERFTVSGAPLAANAAVLQLGIDAALSGRARLRAGYDGVLADDGKDHAVKLTLQVAL